MTGMQARAKRFAVLRKTFDVMCRAWMLALFAWVLACGPLVAQSPAPRKIAQINHPGEVEFQKEILPILRRNCLACHSGTKAEGELVLETPATIRKGGSQGPAVVPGKSGESLLLQLASWQKESFMPPPDNKVGAKPLSPEELGLIQLWIDQGAKGEVNTGNSTIAWQPLPPGINPIYAVAITRDGQYAAASRANQIFVYHIPSAREIGRLTDQSLAARGLYGQSGVADLDLIQSLAFSPDGMWLASGGFRTVKLWRKRFLAPLAQVAGWEGQPLAAAASADGALLAIATERGDVWVFESASGRQRQRLTGASVPPVGLAFTPDAGRLVAVTGGGEILAWDVADGRLRGRAATGQTCTASVLVAEGQVALAGPPATIGVYRLPQAVDEQPAEPLQKLEAEGGAIVGLAAAGATLVAGSEDGTIRRWDVASGKLQGQWSAGGGLAQVALSPDGQRVATRNREGAAVLWDAASGQQVAVLGQDVRAALKLVQVTLDASLARRHVELAKKDLDEANQRKKAEEENQKQAAEALSKAETEFKAKSEAAQKADQEKEAAEKAVAEARMAKTKAEEAQQASDAALARLDEAVKAIKTGQEAAAKIDDPAAAAARMAADKAIAELESLRKLLAPAQEAAKKAVEQAAANVAQAEKKLKDLAPAHQKAQDERVAAERTLQSAQRTLQRAQEAVQKALAAIQPYEEALRQREAEAKAREAELSEATAAAKQPLPPTRWLGISPEGSHVVCLAMDGRLTTWDTSRGVPLEAASLPDQPPSADGAPAAASNEGSSPVVTLAGSAVVLVGSQQARSYEHTVRWELARTLGSPDDAALLVDRVTALDFSPDGAMLAAGSGEPSRSGQIVLLRVADGSVAGTIPDPHSDTVNCLAFSPDGRLLASGGADRFAKVWNVEERRLVRALEGHAHHVLGVAWRADGRVLVTSGADLALKVWDARTGEQLRTIANLFGKEITAVRFLGESESVVACSGDPRVRQVLSSNGSNQRDLPGAADYLYALAASRDGKTVVAGGLDSVLLVWNDQGKEVARFPPPASSSQTASR
jgi:WD40 repeat protein